MVAFASTAVGMVLMLRRDYRACAILVREQIEFCSPPTRSTDVLPKINSKGTTVSVHWFAGVLQSLCSSS